MNLQSVVIDQETGERLPNATVRISNSDGSNVTGGVYADDKGEFSIDVPDTGFILVSYSGYKPAVFPVSLILQTQGAALEVSETSNLEEVTVTAVKSVTKPILFILGLLALSYFIKK